MDMSHVTCLYPTLLILILRQQSADCDVCSTTFPIIDHALSGHVWKKTTKRTFDRCIFSCELDPMCFSVNFHAATNLCEFNLGTWEAFQADFVQKRGSVYISMVVRRFDPCKVSTPCMNGGRCERYLVTRCVCPNGFSGSLCEVSVPVPLGLESGAIQDKDITASSFRPGYEAWKARLHAHSYWKSASDGALQYWTVFLGSRVNLTGIATQGATYETCWVTQYYLETNNGRSWSLYKEDDIVINFTGNKDCNSVVKHELQPFGAIVFRLYPKQWHQCIALRMELYGIILQKSSK